MMFIVELCRGYCTYCCFPWKLDYLGDAVYNAVISKESILLAPNLLQKAVN